MGPAYWLSVNNSALIKELAVHTWMHRRLRPNSTSSRSKPSDQFNSQLVAATRSYAHTAGHEWKLSEIVGSIFDWQPSAGKTPRLFNWECYADGDYQSNQLVKGR